MSSRQRLPRKPEARTEKVDEIVERVRRGLVRVPTFQRGLKWTSSDVEQLFDSIYRGFPVGSLLFYKQPAPARKIEIGPLEVDAPEISEAWWVVDGQQRVTALASCLARPVPIPTKASRHDPFVLYFDARLQGFRSPPTSGRIPSTWVPVPCLFDASQLTEWVFGWKHRDDEHLRKIVFDVGARIREYSIPLYLIETEDGKVAKEIFYRINQAGKPLEWTEVHKALFGTEGSSPATLKDLSDELTAVGMGKLDEKRLLTCLLALRGKDTTRNLTEHYQKDPEVLRNAVQDGLPVLRRVLSFLRQDAQIPHLRLLPKSILLDVLARFFALAEDPGPRARRLLSRWFWRTVLSSGAYDDRTLRRHGINAVDSDPEQSVQRLLALISKEPPRPRAISANFDARADESRIALLALSQLAPRDLKNGTPLSVARLLETDDKAAFIKIVKGPVVRSRSVANRMIERKGTPAISLLQKRIVAHGIEDEVLMSHAIDSTAALHLGKGDLKTFLFHRSELLLVEIQRFADRMAEWQHNDRPSVDYLLASGGDE